MFEKRIEMEKGVSKKGKHKIAGGSLKQMREMMKAFHHNEISDQGFMVDLLELHKKCKSRLRTNRTINSRNSRGHV